MRLAIDIRETCRTPLTGKGRWTAGFVSALIHIKNIQLTLYTDRPLPKEYAHAWRQADIRVISASGIFWHFHVSRSVLHDRTLDAYVSTVSYIVPCLLRGRKPCVTVVHDLIAFRNEPHDKRATFIEHLTARIAFRHSSLVCTVSDATKHDLVKKFPFVSDKTFAIYAGCDKPIASNPSSGDGPIVCIGTLCPRKNQLRLIHAFSKLPADIQEKHPLILIGSRGWKDEEILEAVKKTDHVSFQESIQDDRKHKILSDAVLCAFPSVYEGFGLPVLEAFCAGIPVLTSHEGSLAEVAGDAAWIINPLSEESITNGLHTMLRDANVRASYAKKGLKRATQYSWETTADLFLEALGEIKLGPC